MLARSPAFRILLAFLLTLAMPVCLCHAAAHEQPVPNRETHQCGHDTHVHRDHKAPAHPGCPGHEKKSKSCGCPDLTAALSKAVDFSNALTGAALPATFFEPPAPLALRAVTVAFYPLTLPAPQPCTTLLRQHCALIV